MVPDGCDVCLTRRSARAPGRVRSREVPPSTARRAPAVLTALLLGSLLTACAGTSPSASAPSASAATASAGTQSSGTQGTGTQGTPSPAVPAATPSSPPSIATSPVPATQEVTQLTLVLEDGEVTGDTPLARLTAGRPVRLTVTSDVADELHVHGVDETLDLEPGEPSVLEFTPGSPGRFEVELHEASRVLTRLQVR